MMPKQPDESTSLISSRLGYSNDFRARIRSGALRIDRPSGALRLILLLLLLVVGLLQEQGRITISGLISLSTSSSLTREAKFVDLSVSTNDVQESVNVVETKKNGTEPFMLSLWLLPPKHLRSILQEEVDTLSKDGQRGPTFIPHVTVIGGIPCYSEGQAVQMAQILKDGLKGFGTIPCQFNSIPYSSKGTWSQGFIFVMNVSTPFMNLCQTSRALLGLDTKNWTFPAPAGLPHLSVFYGVDENVPDKKDVTPVPSFYTNDLALWITNPPTLEGVPNWKEVGTIDLS